MSEYSCSTCHYYFTTKQRLDYHTDNVKCEHTCFNCMTSFSTKQKYDYHYEYADCQKVHRCKQCNLDFKMKIKLLKHEKTHIDCEKKQIQIINNYNCNINNQNIENNNNKIVKKCRKRDPKFFEYNPRHHHWTYDTSHITEKRRKE
jgi:hypothetical protein